MSLDLLSSASEVQDQTNKASDRIGVQVGQGHRTSSRRTALHNGSSEAKLLVCPGSQKKKAYRSPVRKTTRYNGEKWDPTRETCSRFARIPRLRTIKCGNPSRPRALQKPYKDDRVIGIKEEGLHGSRSALRQNNVVLAESDRFYRHMLTLDLFRTAPFSSLSTILALDGLGSQIFQNCVTVCSISQSVRRTFREGITLRLSSAAPVTTVHPSGLIELPKILLSCAPVTS